MLHARWRALVLSVGASACTHPGDTTASRAFVEEAVPALLYGKYSLSCQKKKCLLCFFDFAVAGVVAATVYHTIPYQLDGLEEL